jgi:CUG-BP- and ETR3-like factor
MPASAQGNSVKLFVGGVPLEMTDTELAEYFGEFGEVLDCHSLPPKSTNQHTATKAAFVRFSRKTEAMAAIEACHRKRSFIGHERTMDVRVAENKQERQPEAAGPYRPPFQQSVAPMPYRPPYHQPPPPVAGPRTIGNWMEFLSPEGKPYYHNVVTGASTWDAPVEFRIAAGGPQRMPMAPPVSSGMSDVKGPPGCNLFVFHVPAEWTDHELMNQFARFGHVLSARVATEKETGRPKGFGFVSFADPHSAGAAVQGMHGMMVPSGKRLKVSVKRGEEQGGAPTGHALHSAPAYPY